MILMENEMLTSELKGHRTLATVVFTDCVGFSARMSVNEEHTLDLIRRDLKLMKQVCEQFEGRVLKTTGDGLLLCFSSAVKAVECSIAIQRAIAAAATTQSPNDSLIHRIGIHLADMYITPTDIMGNGVNIAARLQTEADPGGICISQTVYDVAKHGLQLVTEYLGPRELKNIREVVPAYKILLEPDTLNDPYVEAARSLEHSHNLPRIRKLIHYVCKNHWESDEQRFANLGLKEAIQEFLGMAPTYEQLRGLLNSAVSTLSKQTEYSLIANEILQVAARFYTPNSPPPTSAPADVTAVTQAKPPQMPPHELQALYAQIAQKIDQHSDALRVKKLLYYVCKRQWESDSYRLSKTTTLMLVQEIHTLAGDGEQLRQLIERFVQTLNKQTEYSLVAFTLVAQLGVLYGEQPSEASTRSHYAPEAIPANPPVAAAIALPVAQEQRYQPIATSLDQHPHALRLKKLIVYLCQSQWVTEAAQLATFDTVTLLAELHTLAPSVERLQQALNTVVKSLSKQAEYTAIANLLVQRLRPLYQPAPPEPAPAANPVADAKMQTEKAIELGSDDRLNAANSTLNQVQSTPPTPPAISLFDARLGIQKYTNPLRAKILAFSALHSDFDFDEQDWFNLKLYELDGLLRGLLQTCKNYTDLEFLLYTTARRLRQPEEAVQAANTVTKCLRTFYINGSPLIHASRSTNETKISLDEFEESTQGLADLGRDYEYTCQLASPPFELDGLVAPATTGKEAGLLSATEERYRTGD